MPENLQDVLDWVNAVRERRALGEPLEALPCGTPGDGCECPVAISLRADCTNLYAYWDEEDTEDFPVAVADFTRAFDRGDYPELIA